MYVQPLDGSLTANSVAAPEVNAETGGMPFSGGPAPAGDNISRFVAPWQNDGGQSPYYGGSGAAGLFAPLMAMLQQLMQMLQSLMGYGCTSPYGSGGCPPYGNQQYFQNANGASEGDPHLSFNGAKWNNMASQPNLLSSNSFNGGFRISTQVTPADAKGVTWNQSATISLNDGTTRITMNKDGQASIANNGQSIAIAKGQTLELGNGASITYDENGSLRISDQNGYGGRIEASLTPEGHGVNVDVTAQDVDLGGTLVNGYEQRWPVGPSPQPLTLP